jgi:uncharacterized protein YegP (UPF0339 family)
MYFETYKAGGAGIIGGVGGLLGAHEDWRWRLKAANHLIIASGQGYTNKRDCLHAIDLMKSTTAATPVNEVAA